MNNFTHHFNIEAEQNVLGTLIRFPDSIDTVVPILKSPIVFSERRHQIIFKCILSLTNQSLPCDLTTLHNKLKSENEWKSIGSVHYLAEIAESVVTDCFLESHAKIIQEKYDLRKLMVLSKKIYEFCCKTDTTPSQVREIIEREITKFDNSQTAKIVNINKEVVNFANTILSGKQILNKTDIIETRIPILNEYLGGGLFKGDMVIIGGPPSMAKTSFVLDICNWNQSCGKNSLFFALDETKEAIFQRILSAESGIKRDRFLNKSFTKNDIEFLRQTSDNLSNKAGTTFLCGESLLSAIDIRSISRKIKRINGLDIVVVDYLSLLSSSTNNKFINQTQLVGENSKILKATAKELNIVMLVVSQLSREYKTNGINENKGKLGLPTQAMLRDSGQIEADANVIIFPWRPLEVFRKRGLTDGNRDYDNEKNKNVYPIEDALFYVAKNKMGPSGIVKGNLKFHGTRMLFYDEKAFEITNI